MEHVQTWTNKNGARKKRLPKRLLFHYKKQSFFLEIYMSLGRILKNRASAQASRDRKKGHLQQLEREASRLVNENQMLLERITCLEASNQTLLTCLSCLTQTHCTSQFNFQTPIKTCLPFQTLISLDDSLGLSTALLDSPAHPSAKSSILNSTPCFNTSIPSTLLSDPTAIRSLLRTRIGPWKRSFLKLLAISQNSLHGTVMGLKMFFLLFNKG